MFNKLALSGVGPIALALVIGSLGCTDRASQTDVASESPASDEQEATVRSGELVSTSIFKDGTIHSVVTDRGRVVFETDIIAGSAATASPLVATLRLHEVAPLDKQPQVISETVTTKQTGRLSDVNLKDASNFALLTYGVKTKARRAERGLPVAQDMPGCDGAASSCGQFGSCCDQHDKCYADNDCTSSSWGFTEGLRCSGCNAEVITCFAITLLPIVGDESECCSLGICQSPNNNNGWYSWGGHVPTEPRDCLEAGVDVRCGDSAQCCSGWATNDVTGNCDRPNDWGYCAYEHVTTNCDNTCQKCGTLTGCGNYCGNCPPVCGDGVCSPYEYSAFYSAPGGPCLSDCGYMSPSSCTENCTYPGICPFGWWNNGAQHCDPSNPPPPPPSVPTCGDNACNNGETCSSCPADCCGSCQSGSCVCPS